LFSVKHIFKSLEILQLQLIVVKTCTLF